MFRPGFDEEHVARLDRLGLTRLLRFASPGKDDHLMLVVVAVVGGVPVGLDHEVSHREVGHAVFATEQDPHRDVLHSVHLHGVGVGGIKPRSEHGHLLELRFKVVRGGAAKSRPEISDRTLRGMTHSHTTPGTDPVLAAIPLGDYQTNAFVVADELDPEACWLVDCGDRPESLLDAVETSGRTLSGILLTHCHHDHIAGIDRALARFGPMPIRCHELEAGWNQEPMLNLSAFLGMPSTATPPDATFQGGDSCPLGPGWSILHLPGHSPGSVGFLHAPSGTLLAGDTLFAGSIGRIDFPTSDSEAMKKSLIRLLELEDDIRVLPGHGLETTIGAERAGNPFLQGGRPSF